MGPDFCTPDEEELLSVRFASPFALALACILMSSPARAERLPLKVYTAADGLARDQITRIVHDSRGFLWFCTYEGLSRFNGYTFTNFTTAQGLPSSFIRDLLETRDGTYWVATGDGVVRFSPSGPISVAYRPEGSDAGRKVSRLIEDHTGTIWVGTASGLYRLEDVNGKVRFHFIDLGMPSQTIDDRMVSDILEDRAGSLWIATRGSGLYRRRPDGRTEHYTTQNGLGWNRIEALLQDRDGRLWAATIKGLCLLVKNPQENHPVVDRTYTSRDGLPGDWVNALVQTSDGKLWVGVTGGLSELIPTAKPHAQTFRSYTAAQGLGNTNIEVLAEDHDGNLWIGTGGGGAMKVAQNGLVTYGEQDGLVHNAGSIFQDRSGALIVFGGDRLSRFDEGRFISIRPDFRQQITRFSWGMDQQALQDHSGEWWLPTGQGLYRFPKVSRIEDLAHVQPKAFYTTKDGLSGDAIYHVYEDARGDVWINTVSDMKPELTRWERATDTFHRLSEDDGWASGAWITAFGEDLSGNLWIASAGHGIARYQHRRFTFFGRAEGLPADNIAGLYFDAAGRLWLSTVSDGVSRTDNPNAERLLFRSYTMAEGLSSNQTYRIVEDRWGRMYVSTGRGVDRLDSETGAIKHYTAADGLVRGELVLAMRDRDGALWFGSDRELSRLVPEPDRKPSPPPIFIDGFRVSGREQPIADSRAGALSSVELGPDENQVNVEFFGVSFRPGETLRYQYRLDGSGRDWSKPTDQRSVNYADLRPGHYRFLVRAVSADGAVSVSPASVAFTIRPPMWLRGWFMASATMFAAALVYAAHRYRVAQLLELERIRTRIATDLHDDIGASLSRVAILSEVVKRQFDADGRAAVPLLTEMAESARDLVASMRDIVWAIDARRDDVTDVVHRVRQFASSVLDAGNIEWQFNTPLEPRKFKLDPEQRRQILLFFKEAIHNVMRHAVCRSVYLGLNVEDQQLIAEVRDDGRGLDASLAELTADVNGGRGLRNMESRAAHLGGRFTVQSSPGEGTYLRLTVPLKRRS